MGSIEYKLQVKWKDLEEQTGVHFYKCIIDSNENNQFKLKYGIKVEKHLITETIVSTDVTPKIILFHNGQPFRELNREQIKEDLTNLERELIKCVREAEGKNS